MEPSVRTFLLLALTFVAVNGAKADVKKILLREAIENVEKILRNGSEKIHNQYVNDIFPSRGCSKNHLCQAAMVLKNTHLNHSVLQRNLSAYAHYTGHSNCTVPDSVTHPLKEFLEQIKRCCQHLNNVTVK